MAKEDLETLEQDSVDLIINLIMGNTDLKKWTHNVRPVETEDLRVVDYGAKFPLIQIKDPSWDFMDDRRDKYTERPKGLVQIGVYNSLTETKQGQALKGFSKNVGIRKVVGKLLTVCNGALIDKTASGFYYLMCQSIETSQPIFIRDFDEDEENFETVLVKVMTFDIRRNISMT